MQKKVTLYHVLVWAQESAARLIYARTVKTKRKAVTLMKNHPNAQLQKTVSTKSDFKYYPAQRRTRIKRRIGRCLRKLRTQAYKEKNEGGKQYERRIF